MSENSDTTITSPQEVSRAASPWSRVTRWFNLNTDFTRMFRFGAIDECIMLFGFLTGNSLDGYLARMFKVKGYGPILGAAVSNSIADGIAAMPEGSQSSLGVLAGTMIPVVPLFGLMAFRVDLFGGKTPRNLMFLYGGAAMFIVGGSFATKAVLAGDLDSSTKKEVEAQIKKP